MKNGVRRELNKVMCCRSGTSVLDSFDTLPRTHLALHDVGATLEQT